MTLTSSGAISISQIAAEFGGSAPHALSEYYRDVGLTSNNNTNVPTSGAISLTDFYSGQLQFTLVASTTLNNQDQLANVTVSDYISAGGIIVIPADFWVWSSSTSTPALWVDVACEVHNYGKILGKGGAGGGWTGSGNSVTDGADGGPAVRITTAGVHIKNFSGSYIAGGGGGGGSATGAGNSVGISGGGGGAGGGAGGRGTGSVGGSGGTLNGSGFSAGGVNSWNGVGGGAGGSGGYAGVSSSDTNYGNYGGGGGGYILPGVGGENNAAGTGSIDGRGGSAGGAGDSGSTGGNGGHSGGGGGWGANGGSSDTSRGTGGTAIQNFQVSGTYNLTNNGTIYGTIQ